MATIDSRDVWCPLSPKQVETFARGLTGFGSHYALLSEILNARSVVASVLVKAGHILSDDINFYNCPIYPATFSTYSDIESFCRKRLLSNQETTHIACVDYMLDTNPEILKTTKSLGGVCQDVDGEPVFIFPRSSRVLNCLQLYASHPFSPVVGLASNVFPKLITGMFCQVFDGETFILIEIPTKSRVDIQPEFRVDFRT